MKCSNLNTSHLVTEIYDSDQKAVDTKKERTQVPFSS